MPVGAPVINKQSRRLSYITRIDIALKASLKKPKGSSRKLSIDKNKREKKRRKKV